MEEFRELLGDTDTEGRSMKGGLQLLIEEVVAAAGGGLP